MSKKIMVLLTFLFINSSVFAEWISQGSNSEVTVFFNSDGLTKTGDTIKAWYLFDYKAPKIDAINNLYSSSRELFEFNCQSKLMRNLSLTWFSGNMANGSINRHYDRASDWRNIAPDTQDAWLLRNACSKAKS